MLCPKGEWDVCHLDEPAREGIYTLIRFRLHRSLDFSSALKTIRPRAWEESG
jgi:hypothetical protein